MINAAGAALGGSRTARGPVAFFDELHPAQAGLIVVAALMGNSGEHFKTRGVVAGANTLGRLRSVLTVTLALVCCSCATRPLQGVLVPTVESASGASRVPILIATTRQRSSNDVGEMFSSERADATSYAKIVVSIPPDDSRKIGEIQWPASGYCLYHHHQNPYGGARVALGTSVGTIEAISDLEE
jgi:hypothetical protein